MKRAECSFAGHWGLCPQPPGIYRVAAKMAGGETQGGRSRPVPLRPLSRRSGCVPAEPYPPLSSMQCGATQLRRTMIFQRTALTPLTPCLTPRVRCTVCLPPHPPQRAMKGGAYRLYGLFRAAVRMAGPPSKQQL